MIALAELYHPLSADPFRQDDGYREVAPCRALAPYIRCFWGSERPIAGDGGGLVIADTCMDIIFTLSPEGHVSAVFCTMDEQASLPTGAPGRPRDTFAIRFYPWSVPCFTPVPLGGCANGRFPAEQFLPGLVQALAPRLPEVHGLAARIQLAEGLLLAMLRPDRAHADVLNALHRLIQAEGRVQVRDISASLAVSDRQLQRLFRAFLGVTPKTMAGLVRYQLLWQEMLYHPRWNVQDAVARFGYADQAHLLHDFRKRHLMPPKQALARVHPVAY